MAKKELLKIRTPMPEQEPQVRAHNFEEVALGYTKEMAVQEAIRCIQCKNQPCIAGCPVEVSIPEFILMITEERFADALAKIKETNVLPAICGRVCPQETQCEIVCTMGKVKGSQPVAIGRLERFVADWGMAHEKATAAASAIATAAATAAAADEIRIPDASGKTKVAVIGSGPAGVTCAGELARFGYDVTIFEALHKTGGVLVYGIPEFRLPKEIVRREIDQVKELGVKIEVNIVIGKIHTIADLRAMGYEAFFIGVGAGLPAFLNIPGTEYNGVLSANEYLTRVNLMKAYDPGYDTPVDQGKRVAVLGGGNVAMDSARTALRLGAEKVMIVYRRSEQELPARREEYEHAVHEGIEFHFLRNPTKIFGDEKDFVTGMEVIKMELGEPDDSGRRRPIAQPGTEYFLDVDMVIMAIGAYANPVMTKNTPGLKLNKWDYIEVDDNMQTSIPDIFAGGDIVTGSATVISAMGAGKQAAQSMHKYLQGTLDVPTLIEGRG
ncbi:MAG: NADPH-dependent glutamate synthase [Chloroflexi bacterium]|nr:NADPH-dependent glutamate synthase [Chloroflexota bacterium]